MQRVLIADDNDQNIYMLETLLKGNGYEVLSAINGAEALDLALKSPPDIIVTDILMPVMDGFTLCRQWKSDVRLKHIPFVFYTATYTEAKDEEFALSLGAERFIIKPQKPDVLMQAIKDVLSQSNAASDAHPLGAEMEFFRQYNDVLFRKLEKKISLLEQTNRALQESMQQTKAILNNIPDIAWLKDKESRYLLVNTAFSKASGMVTEELIGKSDFDIWPEDLATLYRKDDTEVMQSGAIKKIEERLIDHTGKECWIETVKSPIFDPAGVVMGTTGIARDITVRRQAESEKALLEEQLRQAQKMEAIGQLAGGVAHDFNNMLTAIMGYASMAHMAMSEDDPNRHNIDEILAASNKSAVLTQSLLAFSRKQFMKLCKINLNEMIVNFKKFLLRLLREDIELKSNFSDEELPVMADRGQLEQVLMNLVTNARDAMPNGGRIIIETRLIELDQSFVKAHGFGTAGAYALLSVTDTGSGMSGEIRRKIFEPFFTTKDEGKGTGLGLAVVYGIVKQHKGSIDVYSEPGLGSTFKIYLPLCLDTVELDEQVTKEETLPAGGTETILVAEDDAMLRRLAVTVLTSYGYKALEAIDGLDALAKVKENLHSIDLVLMDGIMPNMNGKETLLEIKKLRPDMKAVFMSGYAEDIFPQDSIPGGKTCFIQKPIPMEILVRKIRSVLDE